MIQRIAGALTLNSAVPVTPFAPPRGNFVMSSVQLEVDALGKVERDTPVDATELVQWLQRSFHNHVFKPGQQFLTNFADRVNLKLTVKGFEFIDLSGGGAAGGGACGRADVIAARSRGHSVTGVELQGEGAPSQLPLYHW